MEGPALARRVHHVEHLGTLRLQAFKLALKSSRRYRREQLATYRVDDRESGSPEGVLDFTVSVRFHAVLHLITAERCRSPATDRTTGGSEARRQVKRLVRHRGGTNRVHR